jgi:outer membrane protein assembly factor BamA
MKKNDGVHLYVVVTEHFYIIPDAGGSYYTRKYNNPELWFRVNASLAHRNFGGRGEEIKAAVSFWDSRGLLLSWTKPLLPSDFYLSSALAMDVTPSLEKHYNFIQGSGKLVAGKDLFDNSKIAIGLFPSWNKQQWIDSTVDIRTTELYSVIGWVTDRRNHLFNPSQGLYFYADVGCNHLYHKGRTRPYFQTTSELRLFHPGIFKENVFAARLGMTLRDNDAGPIHYLGLGGVKSIRGYPNQIVGFPLKGNNTFNIDCEYRFPLFRLPLLTIPILSSYDNRFESLDIRIHGALIADFGRIGNTTSDLFNPKAHNVQSGSGLGGGIRVLAPDLETNGCIDVVFGQEFWLPRGVLRYWPYPEVHLYLNFPY